MAVKLSVGLQRKVVLPEFGSLGASCHVEFEIDRSLLEHDLNGFHQKVSDAFVACRQAVQDQLATANGTLVDVGCPNPGPKPSRNGQQATERPNGPNPRPGAGTITQSQLRAIHAISRRSHIDPAVLVQERFQVERPESLSIREASRLIDELKRCAAEVRS